MTLEIITSDALTPLRHGFFTRRGGASLGVYKGLNCGPGSQDQAEIVALNRARVAEAMDVKPDALLTLHQIHSTDVVHVTEPQTGPRPQADGFVTATPGLAISALSADCQPVLFADAKASVIGATHAGWKGALNGVLAATVDAMVDLGAEKQNIIAVVGPSIGPGAYEVGPEFQQGFLEADAENAQFFMPGDGDRLMFNLPGFGVHMLKRSGIGRAEWTGHCTYSDPERFFSYRRSVHNGDVDYGRLIASIRL